MGPSETRDLVFAGAGILWGAVTVFRGLQVWRHQKGRIPIPAVILVAAALALSCLGYLVHQL